MQAVTGIAVEFGPVPRPQHESGLGARHRRLRIAGIFRRVAQHPPRKIVLADADRCAQPIGPARRRIGPQADIAFPHAVLAHGRERLALECLEQPDPDIVAARLQSDAGLRLDAGDAQVEGVAGVEPIDHAPVHLAELIAIDGVVEKIGEVVVEPQRRVDRIGVDLALSVFARVRPIARQREAARRAAIRRIERTEPADQALVDGALRHLIGRIPAVGIGHRRQREPVSGGALAVAQHAVPLAHIIRHVPRTIIPDTLEGGEQRAGAHGRRTRRQRAAIAKTAERQLGDVLRQPVDIVDGDGACGGEVALVGEVRSFADIDRPHQFRNQEIDVGIALPVAVGRHVDRHAVDADGEIRAVVQVKAAQKILVGFALAGMLGDDQPRHHLQRLADARERSRVDFRTRHRHRAGSGRLKIGRPRARGA